MTKTVVATLGRRRLTWLVFGAGARAVVVALTRFQPRKLWVDRTVNESRRGSTLELMLDEAVPTATSPSWDDWSRQGGALESGACPTLMRRPTVAPCPRTR